MHMFNKNVLPQKYNLHILHQLSSNLLTILSQLVLYSLMLELINFLKINSLLFRVKFN